MCGDFLEVARSSLGCGPSTGGARMPHPGTVLLTGYASSSRNVPTRLSLWPGTADAFGHAKADRSHINRQQERQGPRDMSMWPGPGYDRMTPRDGYRADGRG